MSFAKHVRLGTSAQLTPTPVWVPVLDSLVTAPHAAFGLELMKTGNTKAISLRRSSDNAVVDIGFRSNGRLDHLAVANHLGSSDGFVAKYYDQTGNGRDSNVPAAGVQHRIALAGVLDISNGWPSAYGLDAGGTGYQFTFGSVTNAITAGFCVAAIPSTASTALYMGYVSTANSTVFATGGATLLERNGSTAGATAGFQNRIGNAVRTATVTTYATDTLHQVYSEFSSSQSRIIVDGTDSGNTAATSSVTTTTGAFGGQTGVGASLLYRSTGVYYSQFIFYLSSKPTAQDIIDVTARQKAHYGTP